MVKIIKSSNNKAKVLVTRDDRDGRLAQILSQHDFEPVFLPLVRITPSSAEQTKTFLSEISNFDWCIFVSPAAVRAVGASPNLKLPQVAAVGSRTASVCQQLGWDVDFVPKEFTGAALAESGKFDNQKVLLFCGNIGSEDVQNILKQQTQKLTVAEVYKNEAILPSASELKNALKNNLKAVLFTSPSAVRNLREALDLAEVTWPTNLPAVCIGPTTAEAARKHNFTVAAVAQPHTLLGLAETLKKNLQK